MTSQDTTLIYGFEKGLTEIYGTGFQNILDTLAVQAREFIGAHQSAISYLPNKDFELAVHGTSLSDKYAKYREYDVPPDGSGIWSQTLKFERNMRMTDDELKSNPFWKNFSDMKTDKGLEHPPMRGWLAIPTKRLNGEVNGLIQLTDKYDDKDFTEEDERLLNIFAMLAGVLFDLQFSNKENQKRLSELERFNKAMVDRESRMVELKQEVNKYAKLAGKEEPYMF